MSNCVSCGQLLENNAKFCGHCGAPVAAGTTLPAPIVQETSGLAIVSLISGIAIFIPFSALAAVVTGHMARSQIRRSGGRKKGSGMALAGLILGYSELASIIILIVAAIAIPNLLRSKMVANEAAAVSALRTLNSSAAMYATAYSVFPPAISNLGPVVGGSSPNSSAADLIDSVLAAGVKSGYMFTYKMGIDNHSYSITAAPVMPGTTGQRYFYTDESGVIRAETGNPATADSAPLP
jgi:type IV pilus assembly protein PilA